ncbi:AGAP000086-PD, partial [Anopheles gambiae str. PEST]
YRSARPKARWWKRWCSRRPPPCQSTPSGSSFSRRPCWPAPATQPCTAGAAARPAPPWCTITIRPRGWRTIRITCRTITIRTSRSIPGATTIRWTVARPREPHTMTAASSCRKSKVERSKVRVSFFQSSKPQSISPPESLHLYGGQSLIHFGNGGGSGGDGGYDNNNSPLDTYITSAALNQQYDALSSHQQQQQHAHFHPDHRDPDMAAVYGGANVPPTAFNRQMSTESGWDNPFRPGGDLSREADEIVNLIKYGGKPITPTGDQSLVNGSTPKDSHSTDDPDTTVVDGAVAKHEASQLQAAAAQQNGTKSPHKSPGTAAGGAAGSPALGAKNGTTGADGSTVHSSTTPISNQVIPGPQSASHVVIDEKKKKKCTCCVIQ